MTLLHYDGFEYGGGNTVLPILYPNSSLNMSVANTGRTGNRTAYMLEGRQFVMDSNNFSTVDDTIICGFGFQSLYDNASGNTKFFSVLSNSIEQFSIYINWDTRQLDVYDSNGVLIDSTTNAELTVGAWRYFEIRAVMSPSGSVIIRRENTVILTINSIDTDGAGTSTFDEIRFMGGNDFSERYYIDDFYLCDSTTIENNDFLGPIAIFKITPSGNGNYNAWLGSDGDSVDNWVRVDENDIGVSDYVESPMAGAKDSYSFSDLPSVGLDILSVRVESWAFRPNGGTSDARIFSRADGTDEVGDTKPLTSAGKLIQERWDINPHTGVAWTESEVNAAEFGIEVI